MENSFYKLPIIGTFLAAAVFADVVELTNGRKLEGLVTGETTNGVTLSVGVGDVFLKRAQIKRVNRSPPDQAEALRAEWQAKYFTHKNFAPARFAALADRLETLARQRQEAHAALQNANQRNDEMEQLRAGIARDQAEWIRTHQALQKYPQPPTHKSREEMDAYNALVARGNAMQGAAILKQQAIADAQAKTEADTTRVADYIQQLTALAATLETETAQTTNETMFLAQARKQLAAQQLELRRVEVPYEDDGASAVLDVKINDGPSGKFILDTGASQVVLSQTFADWIKLDVNTNLTVKMTLADGQESSAHPVLLRSVQCGEARTVNTPALVTDRPPAPGLDGLLGLSFLREFVLHFDAQSRRVELIRFEPAQ